MHTDDKGGNMKQLRAWRLRRFMTQRQLAEALGVPYQTVQRWESGRAFPRPSFLKRLCEVLQVEPDQLVTQEEFEGKRKAA
jgi:transcriptional regulator with XRE-family HTH domain